MVFNTILSPSILPEMAQTPVKTGNGLALFNYSLAKSSQRTLEACGLTEHKFQVITDARSALHLLKLSLYKMGIKLVTTGT